MTLHIDTDQIDVILRTARADSVDEIGTARVASALQAAVGTVDQTRYSSAFGRVDLETPTAAEVTPETPFDIASITKALVGSTLAMQAVDEGLVDWNTPIADILPVWGRRADAISQQVTFLHILNHTSGLPAWRKFYLEYPLDPSPEVAARTKNAITQQIIDTPLEAAPGTRHSYSDLGYLLLVALLERLFDAPSLGQLAHDRIFAPLALQKTCFIDIHRRDPPLSHAAATERCPLRGRLIRGTVHDENTHIIGGVSTHAGVFSTAADLLTFGQHLLAIDQDHPLDHRLVSRQVLRFAWSQAASFAAGSHVAGWDRPSGKLSSAGRGFDPAHTVGHLGFTGTSLWIERNQGVVSVLLTNRVYPTRENSRIKDLRLAFQEAILAPIDRLNNDIPR